MDEIKGIKCEVKNCVYHNLEDCCMAGQIKVGSRQATKTADTKCETFECNQSTGSDMGC